MDQISELLAELAAESELTRGRDDDVVVRSASTQPNRRSSTMVSVRIPAEAAATITALAEARDVPASALLRGWILSGLADADEAADHLIDRLSADLDRLRSLVRRSA